MLWPILILGALADSSTLVIIGRERQSPLYELPPLQIETILLLASTTEKELSQSLDINDLMAGKMNNGRDWCPTYLSRELENTEFGDLMTITDVLLKDWSEHGTIQEGYYRYPEPGYYPFDKPLFKKLGLNELVYNWNTAGAMYAIDREGYTIYTLGRTGSLPVSYFNSQERSQSIGYRYESQAYHYFATLGNTDLARVVQYTALYQLFIDNNISYSGNTYPSFPKNKPFLLYKPTTELLDKIRKLSTEEIGRLSDSLSQRSFKNYQKEHVDKQLRENEQRYNMSYSEENIDAIYRNVHRDTKECAPRHQGRHRQEYTRGEGYVGRPQRGAVQAAGAIPLLSPWGEDTRPRELQHHVARTEGEPADARGGQEQPRPVVATGRGCEELVCRQSEGQCRTIHEDFVAHHHLRRPADYWRPQPFVAYQPCELDDQLQAQSRQLYSYRL